MATKKTVEQRKRALDARRSAEAEATEALELRKKLETADLRGIELKQKLVELAKEELKLLKEHEDIQNGINRLQFDATKDSEKNVKNMESLEASHAKIMGKLHEKSIELQKQTKSLQLQQKTLEGTNEVVDSIGSLLGIQESKVAKMLKTNWQNFNALRKIHKTSTLQNGTIKATVKYAQAWVKSLLSAVHPLNIIGSLMSSIFKASIELFFENSKQIASMNRSIGDTGTLAKAAGKAVNWGMGVEIADVASAAAGLASTFTSLTSMAEKSQTAVVGMGAELERVNVGASTTGQGMTYLTRAMGMPLRKATKQWKMMAVEAQAFGKTPQVFASEMVSATKTLSSHGPKMMEVFRDLQSVAKASGVEFSNLLKIANRFDTFDTAASSVGNLNALLGGDYMNTLEMMNMTEAERIRTLKSSLEMSGRNFDQMERFERKAIAEAMGTDEATLAQTMKMSNKEARKARREAKKKEKDQKAYNKMIKQTVDIVTRLRLLFLSIFAKTGLMQAFGKAFGVFTKELGPNAPLGKSIREITGILGDFLAMVVELGVKLFKDFTKGDSVVMKLLGSWAKDLKKWKKMIKEGKWEQVVAEFKTKFSDSIATIGEWLAKNETLKPIREAMLGMFKGVAGPAMMELGKSFEEAGKDAGWLDFGDKALANFGKTLQRSAKKMSSQDITKGLVKTGQKKMSPQDKMALQKIGGETIAPIAKGMEKEGPSIIDTMTGFFNTGADKVVADTSANSKKIHASAKKINKAFEEGLKPKKIEKMFKELIKVTDEWGTSLEKSADNLSKLASAASGKGGAEQYAGTKIVMELEGTKLAEYILDTVNNKATATG